MDDFLTFLRINPYPHYLGIAFNLDMRNAIIKEAGFEPRENPPERDYGAVTEFFRDGEHAAAMCIVTFFQKDEPAPWTMAHEAVHVADDVFQRCGIENTDEPYAYLIEWIVRMMVFAYDAHTNTPESDRGFCFTDQIKHRLRMAQNERAADEKSDAPFLTVTPKGEAAEILSPCPRQVYQVIMPVGLHQDTQTLVAGIAQDMANKLMKAQEKYGWTNGWRDERFTPAMWTEETIRHIQKGDPLDVINYLAFARDRKWSTDLLVDGFSAMFVKMDNDKIAVETLNRADMLLDAVKHEKAIDPDNTNEQFESLAGQKEGFCPECNSPRVYHTAKINPAFYCKKCGAEFNEFRVV